MASYLNVTFNHFLAIQRWAAAHSASASVDVEGFTLEVTHRERHATLYPTFQGVVNGRLMHEDKLSENTRAFGGWRPYTVFTHAQTGNKLVFKSLMKEAGLLSPACWPDVSTPPDVGYVLKSPSGSFGRGLFGPFHAGTVGTGFQWPAENGPLFAEQFVTGKMLKVWYWGGRPFFAHMHDYPTIIADGRSTAEALLKTRVHAARMDWRNFSNREIAADCLAYQGVFMEDVPRAGRSLWIDYRYGQGYPTSFGGTSVSDNQLAALQALAGGQLDAMGAAVSAVMRRSIDRSVLVTADGMLDDEGRIWWLEMNTNSLMPPEGYAVMFEELFA